MVPRPYDRAMTHDEAAAAAKKLGAEHADRATHRWVPRETAGGEWDVAKIRVPPGMRIDPLKTSVEAKPKPPQPDDPRTTYDRNVGGPWIG